MARSIKKGPYVVESLVKKIETMNRSGDKRVLKTWARRCTILPEFVGHTLADRKSTRLNSSHRL